MISSAFHHEQNILSVGLYSFTFALDDVFVQSESTRTRKACKRIATIDPRRTCHIDEKLLDNIVGIIKFMGMHLNILFNQKWVVDLKVWILCILEVIGFHDCRNRRYSKVFKRRQF